LFCGEFSPFCEISFETGIFCHKFSWFLKKIFQKKEILLQLPTIRKGALEFWPWYFEYHQIWLNILMDDYHFSNITKLKKEDTSSNQCFLFPQQILSFIWKHLGKFWKFSFFSCKSDQFCQVFGKLSPNFLCHKIEKRKPWSQCAQYTHWAQIIRWKIWTINWMPTCSKYFFNNHKLASHEITETFMWTPNSIQDIECVGNKNKRKH
jgi:hypothetical protein